jgi:hypothetical protein
MFKVIATAFAGNGGVVVNDITLNAGESVYLDILTNDIEQAWTKGYIVVVPYYREVKVHFLYADDDFTVEPYPDPTRWLKLPEYGQTGFYSGAYYTAGGYLRVDQNHTDNWLESTWVLSGDFEFQYEVMPVDMNTGYLGFNPDTPSYRASNQFRLWTGYEQVGLIDKWGVKHELKGPATTMKKIIREGDLCSVYGRNSITDPWGSAIIAARMDELDWYLRIQLGFRGFILNWVSVLAGNVRLAIWSEAPQRNPKELFPELLDPTNQFNINNTTFLRLTDTPDTYDGYNGSIPTVDTAGRQLIWMPRPYITVPTKADRDRITTNQQVQGLKVFIVETQITYVLITPSLFLSDACWIVDSGMYDIVGSIPSFVPGNTVVSIFLAGRPLVIPSGFLGSQALAAVAPTSNRFDISIVKSGIMIGAIRFVKDSRDGAFISLTQQPMYFAPGETLIFTTQSTEDESLQGVSWYILGSLI